MRRSSSLDLLPWGEFQRECPPHSPLRTAVMEQPAPRWQMIRLSAPGARRSLCAAADTRYWQLMPWKPKLARGRQGRESRQH